MVTIIAEKPSVGMDLARIVGATVKKDGYMTGGGYNVTWAFGHLLEIVPEGDDGWDSPLPLLPESFRLRVAQTRGKDGRMREDPGYARQLSVIRTLFRGSSCIINAGDAGREGELIQRYIYEYVGATAPVRRLWISSLTDEAIREGLGNLRLSSDYDDLYRAGKARGEADWLVGINATRALTKAAGGEGVRSLGRVQTPTLAMVCRRFIENRDFESRPFWTLSVRARLGKDPFTVRSEEKYSDPAAAAAALKAVQRTQLLEVVKVEKNTVTQQPPLLFDLTSLQREANRRYSLSAQQVLDAAQALYEKKLITYPRTGSRYITDDIYRTLPHLLETLSRGKAGLKAACLAVNGLSRHSVDASKVTDHHALLPTGVEPGGLTDAGEKVYDLILTRLLEAVSPKCEMLTTSVRFTCAGIAFIAKSGTVITPGWKAVRGEEESRTDEDGVEIAERLPAFRTGDRCPVESAGTVEGRTKPKPLYTEATLLEAMEHAGREVDDEELRDAIRDCGLGTPATRAGEIETLLRRSYMERKGRSLFPTELGLSVYEAVKGRAIADVEMTASWERTLSEIAEGRADAAEFDAGIRDYVRKVVDELLSGDGVPAALRTELELPGVKCPACGRAVMLTTRLARCVDADCGWKIWTTVAGRALSEREIVSLLGGGVTGELKGFRSRTGKAFSARLRLDSGLRVAFEFVDHSLNDRGEAMKCPRCGSDVKVSPGAVNCTDCSWRMWRTVAGKSLSDAMVQTLLEGGTTPVMKGFRSKAGKPFEAALRLNAEGETEFVFPQKKMTLKKTMR